MVNNYICEISNQDKQSLFTTLVLIAYFCLVQIKIRNEDIVFKTQYVYNLNEYSFHTDIYIKAADITNVKPVTTF